MTATAKIEGIYISPKSSVIMESLKDATLIPGVGIQGDRYALKTGTYSAKFLDEPGKNLTMISADSIKSTMADTGMKPLPVGDLRRNIAVRGLTAEALNDMIGHEVRLGNCRVFVHRICVPCSYREAQNERPGLMDKLWDVCGVNCEILNGGDIHVGDSVAVVADTHQPKRVNPGSKPPGFFVRPSERTADHVRRQVIPPFVAGIMCLLDPVGFQLVEDGYNSAGLRFWSRPAYQAGVRVKRLRTPFLATVGVAVFSIVIGVTLKVWQTF